MKASRFFTTLFIVVLLVAVAAPSAVFAKPVASDGMTGASFTLDLKKDKVGSLTVSNATGGTLYVSLSGPMTYAFAAPKQGKTTFNNIVPGRYTITVRTSACGGSLTYNKNIKGKTSLKTVVCRR